MGTGLRLCAELDGDDPDEVVPYPLTYMYAAGTVWAKPGRLAKLLRDLEVRPKAGIIGCPCHGERIDSDSGSFGYSYTGLALRARPDGPVVRGHYVWKGPGTAGEPVLWGNEGRPE